MIKREIKNLINANRTIKENNPLLSITRDKAFHRIKIDKEYWFPKIEELSQEFKILESEVQDTLDETEKCLSLIKSSNCPHHIRLKHFGVFGSHSTCIFCDQTIMSDNCVSWEYSINRNKYCVDLVAKYQDDEDYDYVEDGYTEEELYEIILEILKDKKDDEEVDLVQEFKKLNLNNSIITEKPIVKENYILIINGSNKQYIDEDSYIYKKHLDLGMEFLTYFSSLLGTKIELLDSEKQNSELFQSRTNHFIQYGSIEELQRILKKQQDIPFKIIIDISELYNYQIENDQIKKHQVDLNLEELFPNSKIIRIGNLSKERKEKIVEFLIQQRYDKLYAYQNKKYYSLQNDELKTEDLESTCSSIKRILI